MFDDELGVQNGLLWLRCSKFDPNEWKLAGVNGHGYHRTRYRNTAASARPLTFGGHHAGSIIPHG